MANALKMLIVPLILAAVISGIASLGDVRRLGRAPRRECKFSRSTLSAA